MYVQSLWNIRPRCQDMRDGAQCEEDQGHDLSRHRAVLGGQVIEWSTAPSVIAMDECSAQEPKDVIGIRGVMTNPHMIDLSRNGLIMISESRVVRIHPDKLFTPAPAVAEACHEMLKEERQAAELIQNGESVTEKGATVGKDVTIGEDGTYHVAAKQLRERHAQNAMLLARLGNDLEADRRHQAWSTRREALGNPYPPGKTHEDWRQLHDEPYYDPLTRLQYEAMELTEKLRVAREVVHQRDIEIRRLTDQARHQAVCHALAMSTRRKVSEAEEIAQLLETVEQLKRRLAHYLGLASSGRESKAQIERLERRLEDEKVHREEVLEDVLGMRATLKAVEQQRDGWKAQFEESEAKLRTAHGWAAQRDHTIRQSEGRIACLERHLETAETRRRLAEGSAQDWKIAQKTWQRRAEQDESELAAWKAVHETVVADMRAEATARDIWASSREATSNEASMSRHVAHLIRRWMAYLVVR